LAFGDRARRPQNSYTQVRQTFVDFLGEDAIAIVTGQGRCAEPLPDLSQTTEWISSVLFQSICSRAFRTGRQDSEVRNDAYLRQIRL
jgi:hypothetical protein